MLGIDDIRLALKTAGLEIHKVENNRLNVGVHADEALMRALNDRLDAAWGLHNPVFNDNPQWTPAEIARMKGPRPYHVSETKLAQRAAAWEAAKLHFFDGAPLKFIGMDFGSDDMSVAVVMDANGVVDTFEIDGPRSETGNEHQKEPCPQERLDDDGGPVRKDWDDFPKVGLAAPVDIMAITRSLSGG